MGRVRCRTVAGRRVTPSIHLVVSADRQQKNRLDPSTLDEFEDDPKVVTGAACPTTRERTPELVSPQGGMRRVGESCSSVASSGVMLFARQLRFASADQE